MTGRYSSKGLPQRPGMEETPEGLRLVKRKQPLGGQLLVGAAPWTRP